MRLIEPSPTIDDPAVELAVSLALLRQVSNGDMGDTLRIHHPVRPVAAFGRRDTRRPGFPDAVRHAREAGFEPLVRSVGGRAVAYTESALVIDVVRRESDPTDGMQRRFEDFGRTFADALRGLGVDARVGAVPGEYCPGAQSVNARGTVKLVGTAQRTVRDAWLFSALVVVSDHERLRPVLRDIYAALDQELDVASVGSVTGELPRVSTEEVVQVMTEAATRGFVADGGPLDPSTLELARELAVTHRP